MYAPVPCCNACVSAAENRSRPCQLVSLNGWGSVTVYTVVLMAPSERNAADADIGLRPGSRLKLVRTTQLSRLGLRAMKPLAPRREKGEPPGLDQVRIAGRGVLVRLAYEVLLCAGNAYKWVAGGWMHVN